MVAQTVQNLPEMWKDPGSILGLGRSPGEGNGYPLQYSCLENSMDRGAWQATVHETAKSRTQLSERKSIMSVYKIDNQQGPTVQNVELCSIFCNNLYGNRI